MFWALLKDLSVGSVADFSTSPYSGRDPVKQALKGIDVWGWQVSSAGDELQFTVRASDSQLAYDRLRLARVPLFCVPEDVK